MKQATQIEDQAETVIEILAAQCADLEALLALARREMDAVERNDFEEVIAVVGERTTLGARLEVYHHQIAEMRKRLGEPILKTFQGMVANRTAELVTEILTQDTRTNSLLAAEQEKVSTALSRLNRGQRGVHGYLREGRTGSVAYDRTI
jgi:hypothetical protein